MANNTFFYLPLQPVNPESSAAQIDVICSITKKRVKWNVAAREGWVADGNKPAFSTYYSKEGFDIIKNQLNKKTDNNKPFFGTHDTTALLMAVTLFIISLSLTVFLWQEAKYFLQSHVFS